MKKTLTLLKLFLLLGCLIPSLTSTAQHPLCGFDQEYAEQLKNNSAFRGRTAAFEKKWQHVQANARNTSPKMIVNGTDTTYEIPVVFHIIHTGGAIGTIYNPSDSVIIKLVNYLNQVYGATYTNYPAVGSGGVNIPIRFVLAKRDPQCEPTNGIDRINGVTALGGSLGAEYEANGVSRQDTTIGVTNDELKGIVQWDPQSYYNVWLVNKIDGWNGYVQGGGVVAYSAFPGDLPANDGILIMKAFAIAGQSTLPHEFGHSFSLFHPFQGGCNLGDCDTTGDYVCDTDPCEMQFNCDTGLNPCTNTPWDPVIHNIMNYSDCPDRFTQGQQLRAMTSLFEYRGSLIQSLGGTAPGPVVSFPLPIPLVNCPIPASYEPGNGYNIGPENISIADLQSYSGGYTLDNYKTYVDRTIGSCTQQAISSAHMVLGHTYPVSITTGINPENVGVWIDFNNNGTFSSNELVFSHLSNSTQQYYTHTGNTVAIPQTGVVLGVPLRMRVASDYYEDPLPSGCVDSTYGQAEDFSVIIASVDLPVTLLSISALANNNMQNIIVSWKSGVETKLSRYEVERSVDGKAYARIGTQNAKGSQTGYSFADGTALPNVNNFYRLKMIDIDGTFSYSQIVNAILSNNKDAGIKIYPNPTKGIIDVQVANTDVYSYTITNALGQSVLSDNDIKVSQGNSFKIDLQSNAYAAGLYYLQLTASNGKSERIKFIKQ